MIGLYSDENKRHILERSRYLRNTRYEAVSIVPDLTQSQRRVEQRLRAEADRRNQELTNEDRERNLRWIVVGGRGEKRLIKGTEREDQNNDREGTGSRGGWEQVRGRGGSNRGPVRGINIGPARGSNSGPARGRMTENGSRLSVGNGEPRYSNIGTNIEEGTPMNSRQWRGKEWQVEEETPEMRREATKMAEEEKGKRVALGERNKASATAMAITMLWR